MATDLVPTIPDAAATPSEVETNGLRVKERSIDEQIKADMYAKASAAQGITGFGILHQKMIPPGNVGNATSNTDDGSSQGF